jgi:hypothetical protein
MATTSDTHPGNGSNKLFSITFPYLETSDIDVYLNGALQTITTHYTFANATTVEFVAAPANGAVILLDRNTNDSDASATFFPGSSIKAADLNDNFKQVLFLAQETNNNVANAVAGQIPDGTITSAKIADGAIVNADVNASAGIVATKLAFTQSGAGATVRTVDSKLKDIISVKDFGAVGDGVTDDTIAIQAAIDNAAQMFNQVAFPPAGAVYTSPIVVFPPGAYRITNTLNVYVGLTLTGQAGVPYTVEHTRIIMDTLGGTVNVNKNIFNLTRVFNGTQRSNNVTVTIEDLGFWITNPSSTLIARGGTGWLSDPVTGLGTGGTGSHIYCNEPCIDTRIRRCNFYSSPFAAINFASGATTAVFDVVDCEFDTPVSGIVLQSCTTIWPKITDSRFYGNSWGVYVNNCGGRVQINGCDFQSGCRVKINGSSTLDTITLTGNLLQGANASDNTFLVNTASKVNVTGNTFGISTESGIYLTNVDYGVISGNSIDNAGYNTPNSGSTTAPAAIRLVGCKELVVSGNSISTSAAATYNGYGIYAATNGARISRCTFSNNRISASYNGAGYRNQNRRLNVDTTDILIGNSFEVAAGVAQEYRGILSPTQGLYGYTATQATNTTVDIPLNNLGFARAFIQIQQVSTADNSLFDVFLSYVNFTGVWQIRGVNRDVTANVGLGPHTILTTNTVEFSISGNNLRLTFVNATDPMLYAVVLSGARA